MTKDITLMLQDWQENGDQAILENLMGEVYEELHRISSRYLAQERGDHTLGATGLVNEAYFKLVDHDRISWQNRAHFFGVAAQIMRRILIDYARERRTAKRGGDAIVLSLDQITESAKEEGVALLALEEAMDALSAVDERKTRIVEMKFYAGLNEQEIAEVLSISIPTIRREWRAARIWLFRFLQQKEA